MRSSIGSTGSLLILGFLVLTPGLSSVFPTVSSVPLIRVDGSVNSTNWSGYAVTGTTGSVTLAQASWIVPAVTCASGETSYSAFWVGIDGYQSSTVEQTGTDSDCRSGVPTYYAWYEFFPRPSAVVSTLTVRPGDAIGARVSYSGSTGLFTVAIQDFTTGQHFAKSSSVSSASRSSAEFIVEAPLVCRLFRCHLASLSNFGTVGFGQDNTNLAISLNCALQMKGGQLSPIGAFGSSVQQITMVSSSNPTVVKAQPSALSTDGTSFTVQWLSAGP